MRACVRRAVQSRNVFPLNFKFWTRQRMYSFYDYMFFMFITFLDCKSSPKILFNSSIDQTFFHLVFIQIIHQNFKKYFFMCTKRETNENLNLSGKFS